MEINIKNMIKNWKLFLILIIIFQSLFAIIFYLIDFEIQNICISNTFCLDAENLFVSTGGAVACLIFFIILKYKR